MEIIKGINGKICGKIFQTIWQNFGLAQNFGLLCSKYRYNHVGASVSPLKNKKNQFTLVTCSMGTIIIIYNIRNPAPKG